MNGPKPNNKGLKHNKMAQPIMTKKHNIMLNKIKIRRRSITNIVAFVIMMDT